MPFLPPNQQRQSTEGKPSLFHAGNIATGLVWVKCGNKVSGALTSL